MSAIQFHTLGSIDLSGAAQRGLRSVLVGPKRVALLAYLVLARPRGFRRRDTLLGLFWPERRSERSRGSADAEALAVGGRATLPTLALLIGSAMGALSRRRDEPPRRQSA
jgi:hypothetical protein